MKSEAKVMDQLKRDSGLSEDEIMAFDRFVSDDGWDGAIAMLRFCENRMEDENIAFCFRAVISCVSTCRL